MSLNATKAPITSGTVIEPYLGPGPPQGTGYHNYCLFLFASSSAIEIIPPKERTNYNCTIFEDYVKINGGEIAASTYFRAQYNGR